MQRVKEPKRIAQLRHDDHGRPVPYFVAWFDDEPDFRVADNERLDRCVRDRRCWVCGHKITGPTATFLIGPMCAINRVSAEPPSHRECAEFSAVTCPFLIRPNKTRRESHIPNGTVNPAGVMIERNPGVSLLWTTRHWEIETYPEGLLFRIGVPTRTAWKREGRDATRDEVVESLESGIPQLIEMARREPGGKAALTQQITDAWNYLPPDPELVALAAEIDQVEV